jgi:hypothetical protein
MQSFGTTPRKAALAAVLTCLCFPILRFSWDLGRNTLAMILGIPALILMRQNQPWGKAAAGVLLILSTLSDPIGTPVLVVTILLFNMKRSRLTSVLAVLPACLTWGITTFSTLLDVKTISSAIGGQIGDQRFAPYLGLGTFPFFLYLAGPFIPFIYFLAKNNITMNKELLIWTVVSIFMSPFLTLGYRFDVMAFLGLVPMIFLGIFRLRTKRLAILGFLTSVILIFGVSYVAFPPQSPFPYYSLYSPYFQFIPTSIASNTMPIADNYDVMSLLLAHLRNFDCNHVLVVTSQFYDLALTAKLPSCSIQYISLNYTAIPSFVKSLIYQGKTVFFIWWLNRLPLASSSWQTLFELHDGRGDIGLYVNSPSIQTS